jgi:hypothetical protein
MNEGEKSFIPSTSILAITSIAPPAPKPTSVRETVWAAALRGVSGKMAARPVVHASDMNLRFVIMRSSSCGLSGPAITEPLALWSARSLSGRQKIAASL